MNSTLKTANNLVADTRLSRDRWSRSKLATAALLALGGLSSNVMAQSTNYAYTFGVLAAPFPAAPAQTRVATGYIDTVNSEQGNINDGTATASGVNVSVTATTSSGGVPTPASTINNQVRAIAAGNQVNNFVELNLLVNAAGPGAEGQAILSGQVQGGLTTGTDADGVRLLATVQGSANITETLLPAAPLVVSGNTVSAMTTLNSADSLIGKDATPAPGVTNSGAIPSVGFTSAITGSANLASSGTTNNAAAVGSLVVNNAQTAFNSASRAGSAALVQNSDATLNLAQSTTDLTAPLTVTSNTLSAAFQGNQSTSIVQSETGSGQFTGSTVVTNSQSVAETLAGALGTTASVTGSEVFANVRDQAASFTALTNSLTVSDNAISATSGGNSAGGRGADDGVLAGTAIVYTTGAAITGSGAATSNAVVSTGAAQTVVTTADLVTASSQQNLNTGLSSVVTTGVVAVTADRTTATGSVNTNENRVTTASTGNIAGSLISVDASSFAASAAGSNAQLNNNNTISATNTAGGVSINVGTSLAVDVQGSLGAADNVVRSSAEGNVAATTLNIDATNVSAVGSGAGSSAAASIAGGSATAVSGVSATNAQTNLVAPITSTVTGGSVRISAVDLASSRVGATDASLVANTNEVESRAAGNVTARTRASVSGTDGSARVGVASLQVNQSVVTGTVEGASGVTITAGATTGSTVTANSNTVAASARGNDAANLASAQFGNRFTAGPNPFTGGVNLTSDGTAGTSTASVGLASVQSNTATVVSSNVTTDAFTAIRTGETGVGGVSGSEITVNNNTGSAETFGNNASNQVALGAAVIETTGNAATKLAGLVNVQNNSGATGSATVGASDANGVLTGVEVQQQLSSANVTVATNTVSSTVRGNQAGNDIQFEATSLLSAAATATSGQTTSSGIGVAATTTVQGELSLLNRQVDTGVTARAAVVQFGIIGIHASGNLTASGVVASALTVEDNNASADARTNNASNTFSLSEFATVSTTANLLSQQYGVAPTSASTTADISIVGPVANTDVEGSNLSVKANRAGSLAAGSLANNELSITASNLDGNALIAAGTGGTTASVAGALTTNADYSVANRQSQQTGAVVATADASVRIDLTGSDIEGGTATVVDNSGSDAGISAIAQATSAGNTLTLSSTNSSALTGAVASTQFTDSAITATQTTNGTAYSFGIVALTSSDAPLTVSNNSVTVSAGKNEVSNTQSAEATNLGGGGVGNGVTSYDTATGSATSGADFTVLNLQSGTVGAVSATATPGMIGSNIATSITGGNVTVNNNSVNVTAKVNSANNELSLEATNAASNSGAVSSVQTASGPVTANQVSSGLGASFGVISATVTGAPIAVSGNSVNVVAGQNEAANTLKVDGVNLTGSTAGGGAASITPGGAVSTSTAYSVLNVQTGAGNVTSTANPGLIGARVNAISGGSVTVNDNSVTARTGINQATNNLDLTAGSSLNATGAINNLQTTSAGFSGMAQVGNLTPTVIGVLDAGGSTLTNTAVTVDGNRITAQSGGNAATSALNATAGAAIVGSPGVTFQVLNTQNNLSGMVASVTNAQIGLPNNVGGSLSGVNASVSGNQVLAYGYGNTAANSIGLTNLSGGMNQASAGITNTQFNAGNISATVSGVLAGSIGGSLSGGAVVVTGNTITAQAIGNTAVNRITAK
jgi:hypothetical protein